MGRILPQSIRSNKKVLWMILGFPHPASKPKSSASSPSCKGNTLSNKALDWIVRHMNFARTLCFLPSKATIKYIILGKHRKNCECCPRHSLFKSHKVIVYYVVLNCQQSNQCLKCQVSGHKIFRKSEFFQKTDNFPKF